MSSPNHLKLVQFLKDSGVFHRILSHTPCRTSSESAAARAEAGAPGSVGAKALILKPVNSNKFAMAVLPGDEKLLNDVIRRDIGKFRFANPDELKEATDGLTPGMIPPFGSPIFPAIGVLIVDERIAKEPLIGFNAATFERSVVMSGADYMTLVSPLVVKKIGALPPEDPPAAAGGIGMPPS